MNVISNNKMKFIAILVALFAAFAIFASLSFAVSADKGQSTVVFAEEEKDDGITILATKAKKSIDGKYLLLVTGFDPTNLEKAPSYMGYRYTVNGVEVDTARAEGAEPAKYYGTVTLRTDLEDPSKTQEVTPAMIYGEDYEGYKLLVHEIEFATSVDAEIAAYSDFYAYIEQYALVDESYTLIKSAQGLKYNDKDEFRVVNGDFETGDLTGWTRSDEGIGAVIEDNAYWGDKLFNQHGDHLFSAYTVKLNGHAQSGDEGATGTLTSSTFTLGGSGWISYRLGAGRDYDKVYLEVIEDVGNDKDTANDVVRARFYNSDWTDADGKGCRLNEYRADLSDYLGRKLYIRVTDNATSGYGLFFLDDVVTYHVSAPATGTIAENIIVSVVNGSFDKDFYGWTSSAEIGLISEDGNFWGENSINNTGRYFRGEGREGNVGTMTSTEFLLAGSGFITFKLGAGAGDNCYVTAEKKVGNAYETVALWHNDLFVDGGENAAQPGYGLRMVQYKADLSDYLGETLRIVLHDGSTSGIGFINFDELKTYYKSEPAGTLIADQTATWATFAAAVAAENVGKQGDYTEASYNAYVAAVEAAEALSSHSRISTLESALAAIASTKAARAYRVPAMTEASRGVYLAPAGTQDIDIEDFVDKDGLSSITYEVASADEAVATVSEISDMAFFTVSAEGEGETTVTLTVKHRGAKVLEVEFAVEVTAVPSLINESVSESLDLYLLNNKTNYTLDFTANVANAELADSITATVSVNGGAASAITLTNGSYTYAFGSYNDVATVVTFAVTVAYTHNGAQYLNYNYVLNLIDSTDYRVANGDFETGDYTGWTLSNEALGDVIENDAYWGNKLFNRQGTHLFSAYTVNNDDGHAQSGVEAAKGTLISPTFVVGGSGFITYRLGGAKNADRVWIDVIDTSGNILGRYYNDRHTNENDMGCTLVPYKVDLSGYKTRTVYLRIVDNGVADFGLFFFDDLVTYYAAEPDGFNAAVKVTNAPANVYAIYNGSFRTGDSEGWTLEGNGDIGHVTSANNYFNGRSYEKDSGDDYIFSGIQDQGGAFYEDKVGTLTSSPFTIGAGVAVEVEQETVYKKYLTFKLAGGTNAACFIEVYNWDTGVILGRYHNDYDYAGIKGGDCPEGILIPYIVDLSSVATGTRVAIRVCDYAKNGWGCLAVDNFISWYAELPVVGNYNAMTNIVSNANTPSTVYEIYNGGFERDMEGWIATGDTDGRGIGGISTVFTYWGGDFNAEGSKFFSSYDVGEDAGENKTGTLTSSMFVIGGSGYITYKLGGARSDLDWNQVWLEVVNTANGEVIGRYRNNKWFDLDAKCTLIPYKANLSAHIGKTVYIRVVDNGYGGDYALFFLDSVVTYYENEPSSNDFYPA